MLSEPSNTHVFLTQFKYLNTDYEEKFPLLFYLFPLIW
jgi:hypothetical protein